MLYYYYYYYYCAWEQEFVIVNSPICKITDFQLQIDLLLHILVHAISNYIFNTMFKTGHFDSLTCQIVLFEIKYDYEMYVFLVFF